MCVESNDTIHETQTREKEGLALAIEPSRFLTVPQQQSDARTHPY